MRFDNVSFTGHDSVTAGRRGQQNRFWTFVDLLYLNQGEENTGYGTPALVDRLLEAVPGLNGSDALSASRTQATDGALAQANDGASQHGIRRRRF